MKVPRAQTFERDAEADGYCYSRPPDDQEAPSVPVLTATPSGDTIVVSWTPSFDALSSILDYQLERSMDGVSGWAQIDSPGPSELQYIDSVGNNQTRHYRIRARDNAPTPNVSAYSNVDDATTPPSAAQLQPGIISLTSGNINVVEGAGFQITAERSGAGSSAPGVLVDFEVSGLSPAASPATGTLTWSGTAQGQRSANIVAPMVSASDSGTIRILNARAQSGTLSPSIGVSTANITVQDIPTSGYTVSGVSGSFTEGGTIVISGSGFGSGPTILHWDHLNSGADGTTVGASDPDVGTYTSTAGARYSSLYRKSGISSALLYDGAVSNQTRILRADFAQQTSAKVRYSIFVPFGKAYPCCEVNGFNPYRSGFKMQWFMTGAGGENAGDGNADICCPSAIGNNQISCTGNETSMGSRFSNYSGSGNAYARLFAYGVWVDVETFLDFSRLRTTIRHCDTGHGIQQFVKSGITNFWGSTVNQYYGRSNLPGYITTDPLPDAVTYYADYAVYGGANADCDVILHNAATYAASNRKLHLRPTSWSNTSITCAVSGIDLTNLSGWYMSVRIADGSFAGSPRPIS